MHRGDLWTQWGSIWTLHDDRILGRKWSGSASWHRLCEVVQAEEYGGRGYTLFRLNVQQSHANQILVDEDNFNWKWQFQCGEIELPKYNWKDRAGNGESSPSVSKRETRVGQIRCSVLAEDKSTIARNFAIQINGDYICRSYWIRPQVNTVLGDMRFVGRRWCYVWPGIQKACLSYWEKLMRQNAFGRVSHFICAFS